MKLHGLTIDLSGRRFGRWLVLKPTRVQGRLFWMCRCDCGTEKAVDGYPLRSGKSESCGCAWKERKGSKNPSWQGFKQVPAKFMSRVTNGARIRNIPVRISIEDVQQLFDKQKARCALTGLPIGFGDGTASLDRIDSNKPYENDNVQFLHKDVNRSKIDLTQERFLEICRLVAKKEDSCPKARN